MENIIRDFKNKGLTQKDLEILADISDGNKSKLKRYAQRRLFREPFPYIKGEVEFFGRKFNVDRRVYVPNPETENMVRLLLKNLADNSIVLDVGTGSGCLAITIAKGRPSIKVCASDIDPNALKVAEENSKRHNTNIQFFESYYVDDVPIKPTHIISDMPYGNKNYALPSINIKELQHMPPQSCFHPLGILDAYKELIDSVQRKGWNCRLYFETGLVKKKEIKKIIPKRLLWKYIKFKDYSVTFVDI